VRVCDPKKNKSKMSKVTPCPVPARLSLLAQAQGGFRGRPNRAPKGLPGEIRLTKTGRAGKPLKSDKCELIGDLDAISDPFQSLRTSNSPSMARLSAIKMETHRGNAYRVIK
jgi:hypothetical protein